MLTRSFKIGMNAGHIVTPVIHVNQYDHDEQWIFTLVDDNGVVYTPSTGGIVGLKADGNVILNAGTVNSSGQVVINETQQMTAAPGDATYELLLDNSTHGCANFTVRVEPKPGDNATYSDSDLSLLQEAIDSTNPEHIADSVQDWMDDNLAPSQWVIDNTLSISGAAADAKKVGYGLSELKTSINDLNTICGSYSLHRTDSHTVESAYENNARTGTFMTDLSLKANVEYTFKFTLSTALSVIARLYVVNVVNNEWVALVNNIEIPAGDTTKTVTYTPTEDKTGCFITNNIAAAGIGVVITAEVSASPTTSRFDEIEEQNVIDEYYNQYLTSYDPSEFQIGGVSSNGDISSDTDRLTNTTLKYADRTICATSIDRVSIRAYLYASNSNDSIYANTGTLSQKVTIPKGCYYRIVLVFSGARPTSANDALNLVFIDNIKDGLTVIEEKEDAKNKKQDNQLALEWNGVITFNHRGYQTTAPENTIPAFALSKKNGFKYVETDVRFTSDGVAVLLHDASINRTARNADGTEISSTINIADITYAQALTYDFGIYKGAEYAGTKIPTFEEFIVLCKKIGLNATVELKDGTSYTNERIDALYAVVNKYDMYGRISWNSYLPQLFDHIRAIDPFATLMVTADTYSESKLNACKQIKTQTPNSTVIFALPPSQLTNEIVTMIVNNGIEINTFLVETAQAAVAVDGRVKYYTSNSINISDALADYYAS